MSFDEIIDSIKVEPYYLELKYGKLPIEVKWNGI